MARTEKIKSLSPWASAFGINFLFQIYRGNVQDIIIFAVAFLLIILESTHLLDWIPEFKGFRYSNLNRALLFSTGIYIFFADPDTTLTLWVFAALFWFMFLGLWRREDGGHRKLTAKELKSAWIWAIIGIALCSWELAAFVLAEVNHDDFSYPTISVLVEPHINEPAFRAVFVLVWVSLGNLLIKDWQEPK